MTDRYDSMNSSVDELTMTVPLKNMINELYAKDLSQKICTSIHARMDKGEFLQGRLCYGYMRQHKGDLTLAPDPVTSPYVKVMFELRRVRNKSKKKDWLALVCTDTELTDEEIIRTYGKHWDIEVFRHLI